MNCIIKKKSTEYKLFLMRLYLYSTIRVVQKIRKDKHKNYFYPKRIVYTYSYTQ